MGNDIHFLKENLRCWPDPALIYSKGGCLLPARTSTGAASTQQPGSVPSCLLGTSCLARGAGRDPLRAARPCAP